MLVSNGRPLDFAPQALAEVNPIASATGYFYAETGLDLLGQHALYGHMYRSQPWVNAVVAKLSKAGARLDFNVWDKPSKGERTRDTSSAYAKFWADPCPTLSRYAFWDWTFSTYHVYGEAIWLKVRGGAGRWGIDPDVGVLPMHPSRTVIERDKDTGALTYRFTLGVASAGILERPASEVVHFKRYNPDNIMRGLSPLEPLRTTLFNEDATRRAIESWWRKGARPSIVFAAPASLSDKAYERLGDQLRANHAGADQMGSTLLLEEGVKPTPVQLSAEEMQYIESRKLNREEVCGVYDMPPPMVHILDRATFSNITEQSRMLYRDTMAPILEDVESTIEKQLTPDFGDTDETEGRFALDDVLRGDFETRAAAAAQLVGVGILKPSEGRPMFDLGDAGPEADRLYANSALQPLGFPAEQVRITAGDPANPLPLTPGEQTALDETEHERTEEAEMPPGSKRTRTRNARRGRLRATTDDDASEEDA